MSLEKNDFLLRIPPKCFIHVLDKNTNITRLQEGPKTFIKKDNEIIVLNVSPMINVLQHHYCVIRNPVYKDNQGNVTHEKSGEVKLLLGDTEIRLSQDQFPLYPGEIIESDVTPLRIVESNMALKLKALMNVNERGIEHMAGDEWLFEGPGTYIPVKGVEVLKEIFAVVIQVNTGLRLKAFKELIDRSGKLRVTGEEWIVKKSGSYITNPYEEVIKFVNGIVLSEKVAIHLKATKTFTDEYGKLRKNGEEWLINFHNTEIHIPDVYEEVIGMVEITTLSSRQFCVILDPVNDHGRPQLGQKKLVRGEKSFFLLPGERLENGIQNIFILSENDGLIFRAIKEFYDDKMKRQPGDCWLVRGPAEVIPPLEVEVLSKRTAVALDKNEGIYVRDVSVGLVRSIIGRSYMLMENEELWEKELPSTVEELLCSVVSSTTEQCDVSSCDPVIKNRDKTRVVSYMVPHNAAVQIYDFKRKKSRIIFGPDLVLLNADEQFTLLSLSGGNPKKPNKIKSLYLFLGPDFMSDVLIVETADHACLQLLVSYNWHFRMKDQSHETGLKLFTVPDFIGNACQTFASRIRETVANETFDNFHKNSARIIRSSVFGLDKDNKVHDEFLLAHNGLVITNIDLQSVEPVDHKTRDSLQRSVQLAIEITTKSQEATARHDAERLEQQSRGRLERQMIIDEAEAEQGRTRLLQLKAASAAVEIIGQAMAVAQSKAESQRIEALANVEEVKLRVQALEIEVQQDLQETIARRNDEIEYRRQQNRILETHLEKMAQIEVGQFTDMVAGIGRSTLIDMVQASSQAEAALLESLGLQTALITDGNAPISLFQTANGLIGLSPDRRTPPREW